MKFSRMLRSSLRPDSVCTSEDAGAAPPPLAAVALVPLALLMPLSAGADALADGLAAFMLALGTATGCECGSAGAGAGAGALAGVCCDGSMSWKNLPIARMRCT